MLRLCLFALVTAACSEHPATDPDAGPDGGALQLNDLSILFPIAHGTPTKLLAASASGAHGTLLPEAVYEAAGHITGTNGQPPPGGTGDAAYRDLHVVAMRIDPCFAALAPDPHGAGCENQLRLVFQEVKAAATDEMTAFDSGLHAFYKITREDAVALAKAIASLRVASSDGERLGALAPHPIMTRQGLGGAMADGVRAQILAYAGKDNLIRITEMSSSNGAFNWTFTGFDVTSVDPPQLAAIAIPTIADTKQLFFRGFGGDMLGQFDPTTTSDDNLTPLANTQTVQQLSPAARDAAFAAIVHVDHPARHSPNTIDCASCHLATPVSHIVAKPLLGLDELTAPDAFAADGTFVLPSELSATFDPNALFNLHAFSYVDATPGINQRTVNETAAIVAYMNRL